MKVSREQLEKRITKEIESYFINDKKATSQCIKEAADKYDVPEKVVSNFITLRKNIVEADVFMLFILTDLILGKSKTQEYFTSTECKSLSNAKWHNETAKFPICFDMTRINANHYIGHISVKELMGLKDAQLINYNENAQRTMKHIVRDELSYYQIALNKEAVRQIMDSYDAELYIPNTITLNLPEDASFSYDENKKQLIIKNTEFFDILDGYHRYIAMSKKSVQDPSFDYDMELRIVQFDDAKARRFIWQEDQKTKMRKIDSDSMNNTKLSNQILDRINNDSRFILCGKISRNNGIINAAYLSNIIDVIYLKGVRKTEELKVIKTVCSEITKTIEDFTDLFPDYLEKPWDKLLIYMVCYEGKFGNLLMVKKDLEKVKKNGTIYSLSTLSKADVTRTHKLLGKEGY